MRKRSIATNVRNKWDAKELQKLIQLHSIQAVAIGMAVAQSEMIMRLDRGKNTIGGTETYNFDYYKDYARKQALERIKAKSSTASKKPTEKTKKKVNRGQNYFGKPVDWLLVGEMRNAITVKKPVRRAGFTEITLTLEGGHHSGKTSAEILKYNIKRRPLFWGFGKREFQKAIEAIRKYFQTAAL